ncbi:hypothetical protein LEP1GSC035_4399 [Leptospira noguchii str. 2007001578]|uniref:Uncharacterized protein n=1 Tax=Leptospira noguchii str. 2007001578 TaxID=1049974 RepID=A0ABN0IY82_9LEPT|nr:hypothetical protein LEP1GSC035_4399 [Leptospira noguchii str. 2007001578]
MGALTSSRYYRSIFEIAGTITKSEFYSLTLNLWELLQVRVLEHKNKKLAMKTSFLIRFF